MSRTVLIGPGCIINVASLLGVKGGQGSSVYAASKAGVIGRLQILSFRDLCILLTVPSYDPSDGSRARREGCPSKCHTSRIRNVSNDRM